ncbi:Hint domain-containing protein [Paracoccus sp. MBLB3053]|uniref:Hint domain-containing protein n=1 Tax=Paracoccus aurantius TaxID=3073814 RepID=A0ABU2HYQ1_9RHOB|nr:Hint domain-containing protein [Paracoccus sp. MBLB3053]MDS9470182.1 Hint domain-containing protein [Paracoccus sp. MBLB3053]
MPNFTLWEVSHVTAGDAFAEGNEANTAMGGVELTLNPGANPTTVSVVDDDTEFADGDSTQRLDGSQMINGTDYDDGTRIEPNYSYVIMPEGSSDPADAVTIYAVRMDAGGSIVGFASSSELDPNTTYVFTGEYSEVVDVSYDDLFVCFTGGTTLNTNRGALPIFMLKPGDLIQTVDNGYQPIVWIGQSIVTVSEKNAPVVFERGVLGNTKRLAVSPQHRMLVHSDRGGEVLVAAKALLGLPGVSSLPGRTAHYFHILFERHEIVFAHDVPSESFNPGAQGWQMLGRRNQRSLSKYVTPPLAGQTVHTMAREVIRPRRWNTEGHMVQARLSS